MLAGKKLLFAAIAALAIDCLIWLPRWEEDLFLTGLSPFVAAIFVILQLVLLLVGIWLAYRVGRRLRRRWGWGPMSPTELFTTTCFCFLLGAPVDGASTFDIQIHDTYFVFAHGLFQVFIALFYGILAGVYFCYPRITGRPLVKSLGIVHFWSSLCLFIVIPTMVISNVMPRRYVDYSEWISYNQFDRWATVRSLALAVFLFSQLGFLINLVYSLVRAKKIG